MTALLAALALWIAGIPLLVVGLAALSIPLRKRNAARMRLAEPESVLISRPVAPAVACGVLRRHASSGRAVARRFARPVSP
jgi:hypothetical protein